MLSLTNMLQKKMVEVVFDDQIYHVDVGDCTCIAWCGDHRPKTTLQPGASSDLPHAGATKAKKWSFYLEIFGVTTSPAVVEKLQLDDRLALYIRYFNPQESDEVRYGLFNDATSTDPSALVKEIGYATQRY